MQKEKHFKKLYYNIELIIFILHKHIKIVDSVIMNELIKFTN